jgi:chaperonin GroES
LRSHLLYAQCAESEKTSAGGVLLANDSGDKPNFGTVVAVGEGKKDEEGNTVAPNVAVGATVMYSKYSGTEFEVRRSGCGRGASGYS